MTKLDLSRYEGHSPGPWKWLKYGELYSQAGVVMFVDDERVPTCPNETDDSLIQDAPLILDYAKYLEARVRELEGARSDPR